ncbi:helix-turn-helix transcriptional regulator [Xenorhabdus sp. Vera]|uniref:helix-turn-helix domain-containing protein n=1 Tax=Xenorhabdus koppenhoeferi TaxID=351659 RepID=UPI0019A0C238|nr:helix-turn-helix transcriptional regulator [Xenorhabdus sp. Vera]MBD2809685.1 helix-turn-helix transcriptional regulator [Xenorhabdus sp. Vera]
MSKVKRISHNEAKERFLNTPEAQKAYQEAAEEFELLSLLTEWRENAGLTRANVAEKMGITPPAISRLERNISRATWQTLRRYAAACGVKLSLTARH